VRAGQYETFRQSGGRPYQQHLHLANEKLASELGVRMRTLDEAVASVKAQLNGAHGGPRAGD
jgi:hypothetical protein